MSAKEKELEDKQNKVLSKKLDIMRLIDSIDRIHAVLSVILFKMPDGRKIIEQTKELSDFNQTVFLDSDESAKFQQQMKMNRFMEFMAFLSQDTSED